MKQRVLPTDVSAVNLPQLQPLHEHVLGDISILDALPAGGGDDGRPREFNRLKHEPARPEETAVGAPAQTRVVAFVGERDLRIALAEGEVGGPWRVGGYCTESGLVCVVGKEGGHTECSEQSGKDDEERGEGQHCGVCEG